MRKLMLLVFAVVLHMSCCKWTKERHGLADSWQFAESHGYRICARPDLDHDLARQLGMVVPVVMIIVAAVMPSPKPAPRLIPNRSPRV